MHKKVAVIGAGISGIATAHELRKKDFHVDIFEKDNFVGGRIARSTLDNYPITIGGENIGKSYKNFRNFCSDMGINSFEKYELNLSIISREKKININKKNKFKLISNLVKLLSFDDFKKVEMMFFAIKLNRNNAFLSGKFFEKYPDVNIESFFSKDYTDYILRFITIVNNAAETDEIYLETLGTNLSMSIDTYEHLKDTPTDIFMKFSDNQNIFLEEEVTSLWYENSVFKGIISNNKKIEYDAVVLATTAISASKILEKTNKILSDRLKNVRYFPVAMIIVKYETATFPKDINSYVFPKDSFLSNVGIYGLEKYEYIRYTFSGRTARSLFEKEISIEELVQIAENEFFKHTSIKLPNRVGFTGKITKQTAYAIHHKEFLKNIQLDLLNNKEIYLAGDYLESASIEGCYRSGMFTAQEIFKNLG